LSRFNSKTIVQKYGLSRLNPLFPRPKIAPKLAQNAKRPRLDPPRTTKTPNLHKFRVELGLSLCTGNFGGQNEFLHWQMYCSIDIQTSRNELNTIYVVHEHTHAPFRAHPDAHIPHTCTLSLAQYVTPSLSTAFSLFLSLMYNVSVGTYLHPHTCILHTDCDRPSSSTH